MITNLNNTLPYMQSLTLSLQTLAKEGYAEDFKVFGNMLVTADGHSSYSPQEITLIATRRFEGESDPDDSDILYVLETSDGLKGTLTNAYGATGDSEISKFIKQVPEAPSK